jgi:hypothetical protein
MIPMHKLACRRSPSQSRSRGPASPAEEYWLMDRPTVLAQTQAVSVTKLVLQPLWPVPDVEKLPPQRRRLWLFGCDPISVYAIPSMFRAASRAGPKHDMLQPRNVGADGCSKACRYRVSGGRAGDHNFPVNHAKSPNVRDSPSPQYTPHGAAHTAKFRVPSKTYPTTCDGGTRQEKFRRSGSRGSRRGLYPDLNGNEHLSDETASLCEMVVRVIGACGNFHAWSSRWFEFSRSVPVTRHWPDSAFVRFHRTVEVHNI